MTYIKTHDKIYFGYTDKTIGTARRNNRIDFLVLKPEFNGTALQIANATDPTFESKSGPRPNADINYQFNDATNELTFSYKLVVRNQDKSFTYSNNVYTSTVVLTITNKTDKTSDGSDKTTRPEIPVVIPTKLAKYKYVYDNTNNYYKDADGKSGRELFDALLRIQQKHRGNQGYDHIKEVYNETNAFKDKYYENDGTMLDIYSENPSGTDPYTYRIYDGSGANQEGQGMNREHVIPQSWFNREATRRADIQHIFPTDIKVNAVRSNYPHDEVTSEIKYTSENGGKLGKNSLNKTSFEPIDEFKGDIARAYLYFLVTYGGDDKKDGAVALRNKNGSQVFETSYPYMNNHYLNVYLKWNAYDAVSQFDVVRNNEIIKSGHQSSRNPFIDYPDLADSLFGQNPKPFVNKGVLKEAIPLTESN
ncbi:endonuclease [Mycoplasmopsis verecunda]|uniref:Endonuclease I n=1 Tax=Mycoplasmopsis verecunda TaxID=171291 RepID=A0A1T4LEQ2_9BACT|nr:endonuclease [Mycoplasmopsis verecunda]WPB54839.1 endonuclease [Mycoplasmopsis verecunda]SJZ53282.1 Endonuclease I [Mycoplasmopsis verecunda]